MIPSAVFVPVIVAQIKFSLSSKFLRNLGSMPKTSTHVGSYRINRLLFADDLVLFASSQQCLQHAFNRFSALRATDPE